MGSEHYCLRWNNHQSNLLGVFSQLLHDESLVDVTLACSEGASIRAHKVVLSACSSYFQALFLDHPSRHPIVILKDVHFAELRTLVEFMYKGEVNVQYCQLSALLKTAESLKVKGLAEMTNLNAAASTATSATSTTSTSSSTSLHESTSDIQIQHAASSNPAANSSNPPNAPMTRSETVTTRNQTTNSTSTAQNQTQTNQIPQPLVLTPAQHQPHDSQSRLHVDTMTRHDRKANNGTVLHHATCTDTSETQSMKRLTNPPEESYTPPPRLEQSPLPLVTSSRVRTNRSEPPDPGPDNGSTPMVCDDNTDEHNAKTLNNNNTTAIMMHTNCTDVGLNMSISASSSTEHSRLCLPASSGVLASAASSGGASSSQVCRLPPAQPPATPPPLPDPIPGPSGLPPVQQVPLSLKKEVDWERAVEEIKAESSSAEYLRHAHDQESDERGSPRLFPCVYCGAAFPHQSKLTRHILSHSLETLKYREQRAQLRHSLAFSLGVGGCEPLNLMDPAYRPLTGMPGDDPRHESAHDLKGHEHGHDAHDGSSMELDFSTAGLTGSAEQGSVVLCKFCGKSFPDVSSLIVHLPVHTGDRPFKCEFCGKAFKLRHHMKDHCRVHTGERPFRCALCGKTFSRSTILKAHEKTHYPKYVRKFLSPSPVDNDDDSPHQ